MNDAGVETPRRRATSHGYSRGPEYLDILFGASCLRPELPHFAAIVPFRSLPVLQALANARRDARTNFAALRSSRSVANPNRSEHLRPEAAAMKFRAWTRGARRKRLPQAGTSLAAAAAKPTWRACASCGARHGSAQRSRLVASARTPATCRCEPALKLDLAQLEPQ